MSRELLQQALDALEFPHDSEWSNKAKAIEALQHALAQPEQFVVSFPSFMRKRIEQAMEDAIHPKGMSVHDGKATVLASDLHRMLLVIDSVLAQPEQEELIQFKDGKWSYVRKPWVGLTDEEIKEVLGLNEAPWSLTGVALQHVMDDVRALEAKLKEKNGA